MLKSCWDEQVAYALYEWLLVDMNVIRAICLNHKSFVELPAIEWAPY